jgi:hypothetical protein
MFERYSDESLFNDVLKLNYIEFYILFVYVMWSFVFLHIDES